ncbi:MAG: UxaA family hydrolase [Syntrophales bacterium]|nr:UxaA family hydrolase [Syntrophales bacterium]
MRYNVLIIDGRDNVGVALRDLAAGEEVLSPGVEKFAAEEAVPASHKVALRDIAVGEEIVKYGEVVGVSAQEIRRGAWVHTHNLESERWKK